MKHFDAIDGCAITLLVLTTVFLAAVDAHCQVQPELVTEQTYAEYLNESPKMDYLPDAPSSVSMLSQSQSLVSTTGLSRSEKWAIALNAGFRIADATQTCIALHNGGFERWMTQSCGVNAALILGGIPAQYFGMKLAKRAGHPWMSKIVEWGLPLGSAYAIAYSTYHWDDPKRRKP